MPFMVYGALAPFWAARLCAEPPLVGERGLPHCVSSSPFGKDVLSGTLDLYESVSVTRARVSLIQPEAK